MNSGLRLHGARLALHGAEVTQFRMPPARVLEALDVVEDPGACLVAVAVNHTGRHLGLQRREGSLHRLIAPDVPGTAHRKSDAVVSKKLLKLLDCALWLFEW